MGKLASGRNQQFNGREKLASGSNPRCNCKTWKLASGLDSGECHKGVGKLASGHNPQCNKGIGKLASGHNPRCNKEMRKLASGHSPGRNC